MSADVETTNEVDVERVVFYSGSRWLGVSRQRPFSIDWRCDKSGEHLICDKVFDSAGGTAVSELALVHEASKTSDTVSAKS